MKIAQVSCLFLFFAIYGCPNPPVPKPPPPPVRIGFQIHTKNSQGSGYITSDFKCVDGDMTTFAMLGWTAPSTPPGQQNIILYSTGSTQRFQTLTLKILYAWSNSITATPPIPTTVVVSFNYFGNQQGHSPFTFHQILRGDTTNLTPQIASIVLPAGQDPSIVVPVIIVQANGLENVGSTFQLNLYEVWMEGT